MAKLKGKARAKARKAKIKKDFQEYKGYKQKLLELLEKHESEILSEECDEVNKEEDVKEIVEIMKKVLRCAKKGVGLAASQIGVKKRIVIAKINREEPRVFINPEILIHSGRLLRSKESCLSYPGFEAVVDRYENITIRYEDMGRKVHTKEFHGFNAVLLDHEVDHTLGVCKVGIEWKKSKGLIPAEEVQEEVEEEVVSEE